MTGNLQSLGDYADSIWQGIAQSFADMAADMVAQYAVSGLRGLLTGDGGNSLVSGIIGAASGIWDAVDWMGGDILDLWHSGAWSIDKDQIAQLQAGEMVIPADMADYVQGLIEASGGGQGMAEGLAAAGVTGAVDNSGFAQSFGISAGISAVQGAAADIAGVGSFSPMGALTAGLLGALQDQVSHAFGVVSDPRTVALAKTLQTMSTALGPFGTMVSGCSVLPWPMPFLTRWTCGPMKRSRMPWRATDTARRPSRATLAGYSFDTDIGSWGGYGEGGGGGQPGAGNTGGGDYGGASRGEGGTIGGLKHGGWSTGP